MKNDPSSASIKNDTSDSISEKKSGEKGSSSQQPSGFVLKLFHMVNGAPDNVISWLPGGDAFRISDLDRLQNETLPSFFRHSRFQSLVRQLNFYNFRKVNRERTFWVYRHPLFHRDRPNELHLLRRKTCPGVDGRKHKPDCDIDMLEAGALNNARHSSRVNSPLSFDHSKSYKKTGGRASSPASHSYEDSIEGEFLADEDMVTSYGLESTGVSQKVKSDLAENYTVVIEPEPFQLPIPFKRPIANDYLDVKNDSRKQRRIEEVEQSMVVTQVAQKLQDYAKKASSSRDENGRGRLGKKKGTSGRENKGAVQYTRMSDTMKYHGVTYDDECGEISETSSPVRKNCGNSCLTTMSRTDGKVVSPSDSENDSISCNTLVDIADSKILSKSSDSSAVLFECKLADTLTTSAAISPIKERLPPPVDDKILVASIMKKLATSKPCRLALSGPLAAPLASFCMETAPQCLSIGPLIRGLLVNCRGLADEFGLYREALFPHLKKKRNIISLLDGSSSAVEKGIISEFKVFAVNHLLKLVSENLGLDDSECAILNDCAEVWQKCAVLNQ